MICFALRWRGIIKVEEASQKELKIHLRNRMVLFYTSPSESLSASITKHCYKQAELRTESCEDRKEICYFFKVSHDCVSICQTDVFKEKYK